MTSKRHKLFNTLLIALPWSSLLFIGKSSIKRYSLSSALIGIIEILNHVYGHKKKWWTFYDKPKSFLRDELPFDLGPYPPLSMWILKYSYGNFKRFVLLNVLVNGAFAFFLMPAFKKLKIIRLNRLNYFQFFLYIHYKAYLLYGLQYLLEKVKGRTT